MCRSAGLSSTSTLFALALVVVGPTAMAQSEMRVEASSLTTKIVSQSPVQVSVTSSTMSRSAGRIDACAFDAGFLGKNTLRSSAPNRALQMRALDWPQVTVKSLDINGDFVVRSLSTRNSREAFKVSGIEFDRDGNVYVQGRISLTAVYNGGDASELQKDYEVRDARVQGAFTFSVDVDKPTIADACRRTIDSETRRVQDRLDKDAANADARRRRELERQRKAHYDALARVDQLHQQASQARSDGTSELMFAAGYGVLGLGAAGVSVLGTVVFIVALTGGDPNFIFPIPSIDSDEVYIPIVALLGGMLAGVGAYFLIFEYAWPAWDASDAAFARAKRFDEQAASMIIPPLPME